MLFRATPGFERIQTRLRNEMEEIDIDGANRSADPTWANEGPYLVGECKNWSKPCGAPELRAFHGKLTTKFGRVRGGFFIAPGGVAKTFADGVAQHATATCSSSRWMATTYAVGSRPTIASLSSTTSTSERYSRVAASFRRSPSTVFRNA